MIHELLPNMIKVIKILRARRMIRLPPERYDLNRPLVVFKCNWAAFNSRKGCRLAGVVFPASVGLVHPMSWRNDLIPA